MSMPALWPFAPDPVPDLMKAASGRLSSRNQEGGRVLALVSSQSLSYGDRRQPASFWYREAEI